ncbi:MAG: DUF4143 domain-containing protein [Pseudonocardiaceae bacterium]
MKQSWSGGHFRLFESLIALNLRVYAQANEATVHHLRTRNGDHEIDFIIERDDHKIVALEVKLSSTVDDSTPTCTGYATTSDPPSSTPPSSPPPAPTPTAAATALRSSQRPYSRPDKYADSAMQLAAHYGAGLLSANLR